MPTEEARESTSSDKKSDGFTNIAATGDDNKMVFTVEEKKVFRDPYMDMASTENIKGILMKTHENKRVSICQTNQGMYKH